MSVPDSWPLCKGATCILYVCDVAGDWPRSCDGRLQPSPVVLRENPSNKNLAILSPPFQGRRGCWLGYGFTAYILTCLKTRKKDLRTFGKPLVVRYERAGLMAPLQRGGHAYFTYAMWRGLTVQLRRPLAVQSSCAVGKSLRQKSGDFCHLPFQGEARVRPAFYRKR